MSTDVETASATNLNGAMLDEQILGRYVDGVAVAAMQLEFGMTRGNIIRRVNAALERRIGHKADEYREVVNKGLDQQMESVRHHLDVAERMIADATARGDLVALEKALAHHLKAIDTRTRIIERRSKLNGLDAPVRIDARVEMTTPADSELQALIAEANRRADEDRQRLAEAQG